MKKLLKITLLVLLLTVCFPGLASADYGPDKHTRFELVNEYGVPQPVELFAEDLALAAEPWRTIGYSSNNGDTGLDTYFPIGSNPVISDAPNNKWNFSVTETSPELVVLTRDAFFKRTPVEINNYQLRAIGMINDAREDKGLDRLQISNALIRYFQKYPKEPEFSYELTKLCLDFGSIDCANGPELVDFYGGSGDDDWFGFDYFVNKLIKRDSGLFNSEFDTVHIDVNVSGTSDNRKYTFTTFAMKCSGVPDKSGCELTNNTGDSDTNVQGLPNTSGPGTTIPKIKSNPKLKILQKRIKRTKNRVRIKVVASVSQKARGRVFMTVSTKKRKKTIKGIRRGNRIVFKTKTRNIRKSVLVRVLFRGNTEWKNTTRRFKIR